ncbi:HPr family phosphocarrier protein [Konateibacter massiliensis]|uniref:HPr family phosphocarrier protein n=1 Tax=Konateibacter massiliensis TaxID=2002841 RepID=UPI001F324FB0|nr:HPr family phosphocarrier protein [Konateibacter massiliensis]
MVSVVNTFISDVDVACGSRTLDAKSLLSVMSLDLRRELSVRIISDNIEEYTRFIEEMEDFK